MGKELETSGSVTGRDHRPDSVTAGVPEAGDHPAASGAGELQFLPQQEEETKAENGRGSFDWRGRRRRLIDRLRVHPCTMHELLDLFPSMDACKKCIAKLVRRRLVRIVGTVVVSGDGMGRPRYVYSCRAIRPQ